MGKTTDALESERRHLLLKEKFPLNKFSTFIVTARSDHALNKEVHDLLGKRLKFYFKPFDHFKFENDLITTLGLESRYPKDWLEQLL